MIFRLRWIIPILVISLSLMVLLTIEPPRQAVAQQPTGSVPTVTGTPTGTYVRVIHSADPQINVRSGPSSYSYPVIGVLLWNQQIPALGRSPGGDWIQIVYPGVPGDVGWVYAPLVSIGPPGAVLSIVEPPPTPAPATTPTIDPTLAAAFMPEYTPTRLPTFTPPGPLFVPTYETEVPARSPVPMGLVIALLAMIGGFGTIISFLRGR
jgi:hypothetical protein